jgi:hypothetical protein
VSHNNALRESVKNQCLLFSLNVGVFHVFKLMSFMVFYLHVSSWVHNGQVQGLSFIFEKYFLALGEVINWMN